MAIPVPVASGTGDQQISDSKPSRLMGWSLVESHATTPALSELVLRNGTTTGDPEVAHIKVPASGSDHEWFGPQGITCKDGIFLDRVVGTTTVVVFIE